MQPTNQPTNQPHSLQLNSLKPYLDAHQITSIELVQNDNQKISIVDFLACAHMLHGNCQLLVTVVPAQQYAIVAFTAPRSTANQTIEALETVALISDVFIHALCNPLRDGGEPCGYVAPPLARLDEIQAAYMRATSAVLSQNS